MRVTKDGVVIEKDDGNAEQRLYKMLILCNMSNVDVMEG